MRKSCFMWMSVLCMLMSLSLVSCSDDENGGVLNIPNVTVSAVSFTDESPAENKIKGTLRWTAPAQVENVTKYVIYASSGGTDKTAKLGEVPVAKNSFVVEEVVNLGYLLVVAANADGESERFASLEVKEQVDSNDFAYLYVLSSGNMGNNNASLTLFDIDKDEVVQDYFMVQNKRGLGDTAQDMIVYGNKMYIAVYGESTIEVTDLRAKSIKQIKTEGQPRSLISEGGKVYISYYNGYVARLDTASLNVEAKVKVGRNPEQMAVANGKIYVANSGGMDWNTEVGYDKTVSVVDLPSFKVSETLDVVLNPVSVQADEQGNVYVISMGNYGDILNTLQCINSSTHEISIVDECSNATEMVYSKGILYMFYSQWDEAGNQVPTYLTYNTSTKQVGNSFIADGTDIKKPYKISIAGRAVYVTESNFKNEGDAYGFTSEGKLLKKLAAGLNPIKVVLAQMDSF